MFAAEPPPAAVASAPTDQRDVIEVVGTRTGDALKIDRRTYRVQQTPHSEQKDAIQLLRGVPAVTVSPDDTVSLLGNGNVRIYVDGRPYLGDPAQYLRTLHGSDVERIEIMTNPSAQYSAEGSAGIINFVLRKKQSDTTAGTISTDVVSPLNPAIHGSIKFRHGKWTLELAAAANAGRRPARYTKNRTIEEFAGGPAIGDEERGGGSTSDASVYGSAKVTYDLDARTSLSANLIALGYRQRSTNRASLRATTPGFDAFDERLDYATSAAYFERELAFDHKGSTDGETLTASLSSQSNPRHPETGTSHFSNGGSLFTERLKASREDKGQIDWQHPVGKHDILSVGGTWSRSRLSERYRFDSANTGGLGSFTAADQFVGVDHTLAAYLTYQHPIGSWTVMPGVRVERDRRDIASPGHPDVQTRRTDLFPTLHVDHPLSANLTLTLSYSKRIDRPSLNELRPYAIVQDVLNAKRGNPSLRNQSTDAYEINLHYHRRKLDAGLIVYDRETSHLWSTAYATVDGINVNSQINSGHSRDRGAELDVSTPLASGFKVNASLNLFDQRFPIDAASGTSSQEQFRFTSDSTLEWDGPDRGKIPGDIAQVQWIYYSPYREFDVEQRTRNWLSISYTHSLSRTLSVTGSADYATGNRHRLDAPLLQETFSERRPTLFKVKLLKTFGKS